MALCIILAAGMATHSKIVPFAKLSMLDDKTLKNHRSITSSTMLKTKCTHERKAYNTNAVQL